tara:strand:+ start:272 stop:1324 length:1053 start_codon:yes stop_codon:yes gene_type:complete
MFFNKLILKAFVRVLLHLLFWCGVLLFFTKFFSAKNENFNDTLLFSLFIMPITIATTYVSAYKLIPDYLITKRYLQFVLYSLYTLIISGYVIMLSVFFSLIYLANFQYEAMNPVTRNIFIITSGVYLVVILVSAFKLLQLNLKHTEKTKKLENKILETQLKLKEQELQYLKMQIHPHFLFNTLNTMYGFALKKADETPEMILKLSNLLDYLLYQVDKPFVLLTEEIHHIEDYIALENLRFNDTLDVNFNCDNIPETTKIAPMLLLPFVENSFKHGRLKAGKLSIHIELKVEGNQIVFSIENTSSKIENTKDGIGLQNIQKRLDLLYKNQYHLTILNSDDLFKVRLTLKTN